MRLSSDVSFTKKCIRSETDRDLDLWISLDGNDITGNGSFKRPYASFIKIADVLKVNNLCIQHKIRILLQATNEESYYIGNPALLDFNLGPTGSISFIGVGDPVSLSGPYVVTDVQHLGQGGVAGHRLITAGLVDGILRGKFIRILTGPAANMVFPVSWNTETSVDIRYEWNIKPTAGCLFEVIRPAVTIQCTQPMVVNCQNLGDLYNYPYGDHDFSYARVAFLNLTFDFSHLDERGSFSAIGNSSQAGINYSLVSFKYSPLQLYAWVHNNCSFNYHAFYDDGIDIVSKVNSVNLVTDRCSAGLIVDTDFVLTIIGESCVCGDLTTYGCLGVSGNNITIMFSSICGLSMSGGNLLIEFMLFREGTLFVGMPICSIYGTQFWINHSYFIAGENCFEIYMGTHLWIGDTACSSVVDVACIVGANCRITTADDCLGLVGANGAYTFKAIIPAVTKNIWPTIGTGDTDGIGTWVVHSAIVM